MVLNQYMKHILSQARDALQKRYSDREIRFLVKDLLHHFCGCSDLDFYTGKDINISLEQRQEVNKALRMLSDGMPIQYILGECEFYARRFLTQAPVLIPRPETEELVDWIVKEYSDNQGNLLDVGTGSGCIAVSLAAETSMKVEAWDILPEALALCRRNADLHQVKVEVKCQDLFKALGCVERRYDVLVSNPPYICQSQASNMQENVLSYESHLALFVPDEDALKYYRALAELGKECLKEGGCIYMEINELFGDATANLFRDAGYRNVELRRDLSSRDRMIKACL